MYDLDLVNELRLRIGKFVFGVSKLVKRKCKVAMLIRYGYLNMDDLFSTNRG